MTRGESCRFGSWIRTPDGKRWGSLYTALIVWKSREADRRVLEAARRCREAMRAFDRSNRSLAKALR